MAATVCELSGWSLSQTRFLIDGDRLQNDMTFIENDVENHALVDIVFEMVGGKGPTDGEIRKMLEEAVSESEDEVEDTDNLNEPTDETAKASDPSFDKESNYRFYKELKIKLSEGTLSLSRSKDQDQKLLFLLETESLQPYELLRLRNVYLCWEQNNQWRESIKEEIAKDKPTNLKVNEKASTSKQPKRPFLDMSREPEDLLEKCTPIKRQKLLETFGLDSPSPLKRNSHVTEIEMKGISVSIHLWAERTKGGVKFLHNTRLEDFHFEEILKFTGPTSKWKLLKNRTIPQLRSLWRNTFGGKHYYRGDKKTGFENELKRHCSSVQFCPFNHCSSGIMSPMDVDLVVLTPTRKCSLFSEIEGACSSRKLFQETDVGERPGDQGVLNDESSVKSLPMPQSFILNPSKGPVVATAPFHDASTEETSENGQLEAQDNPDKTENSCANNDEDEKVKEEIDASIFCKIEECGRSFHTFFGLERHLALKHSTTKYEKEESVCKICAKKVIYLGQHMRAKHSDVQKQICEVCGLEISVNMQKHRKQCIKCRYCDYENCKKARLLNHIEKCDKRSMQASLQSHYQEPLDLRSPLKLSKLKNDDENNNLETGVREMVAEKNQNEVTNAEKVPIMAENSEEIINEPCTKSQNKSGYEKQNLEKGRLKYPFDDKATDEDYYSEIDIDDSDLFTMERRRNKDNLELELRSIDGLENSEIEGDKVIVEKFKEFMRNKRSKDDSEGGYSKQTEPTTINAYASVVQTDILRAFHKLVEPFDARWLIDCKTPKDCKFEGEERLHVSPKEPIYMTSRILQEALSRHEVCGNSGNQKKKVIAAFNQLMAFIELHFTLKLNAYGVDVLSKVQTYHQGVKSFIIGTSQWKKNNDEEKEGFEKNKLIHDYECPNKDVDVLEKYKEYVKSEERVCKISKLLSFSHPDAKAPSSSLMTEFGISVMEEIAACTGCRPKVARHLSMGPLADAKPGFNPYKISMGDKTVEEDHDGDKIYRRVNPNLPPKEKACVHQIKNKSAVCPENCENQCTPEGYNIWVTWDKTQSTKGPYFLHIPSPVKTLMDRYDIIRTNFFRNKRPKFATNDNWLEDPKTPFFLNSACGSFPSLDLKKLSSVLGIDITAYSFRKMVSTWALTHKCEEIRTAEQEALQHSLHVAKERYHQSKQVQPQTLTQAYIQEENMFPEKFREELDKDKSDIEIIVAKKQEERAKLRYSELFKQKGLSKKLKYENKPLGLRTAILESDRQEFTQLLEDSTGSRMESLLSSLKPVQFRDYIVRVVCSSTGESGEMLRQLWSRIYKGDLQHGIRDLRSQAKERSWPLRKQNPGRRDRNSWIAHNLRKSCQAAQKFEEV